ncbi:DUF3617 domain-containing protein [Alkalimonas sp.]|uniref:DUF3617 domain-containing protein n=1 Tax=Alkalimonas sp. TaxID=1872453 RepID=UPI00263B597F|nr:DUF3617 domain-containing protein [Alkalimonas sp.]
MKSVLISLSAALFAFFITPAQANSLKLDMEPGLWEHSFSMKSESGELEKAMAEAQRQLEGLPAAQRRMMESMLEQQGIRFGGTSSSIRVCLTQQEIDQGMLPQQDGCQQTLEPQGDNRFRFSFQCDTNPPSRGQGEMVLESPRAYRGNAQFTTEVNGRAERMTMQQQGKWLQAECSS